MRKGHLIAVAVLLVVLAIVLPGVSMAATATCHVVDPSGKPVVGATVYVFSIQDVMTPKSIVTDSTGSFTTDVINSNPDDGSGEICMVVAKGLAISGGYLSAGENTIQLSNATKITGKVVDANGAPVPNASVAPVYALVGQPTNGIPKRFSYFMLDPIKSLVTVKTDTNGIYAIPDIPADLSVFLHLADPKYVDVTETVEPGATAATMTAKLGATITGKVVRKDGKPVGDVTVEGDIAVANGMNPGKSVQSSPDGKYSLTGMAPGEYTITVPELLNNSTAVDWASPEPVSVDASIGAPIVAPDLILEPASTISGSVVDADTHQPVAGVNVTFQDASGIGTQTRVVVAVTDQQGKFSVHVWAGKLSINIYQVPQDYLSNPSTPIEIVSVAEGQTLNIDPIQLQHGLSVTGTVLDNLGYPVLNLTLQPQNAQQGETWMNLPSQVTDQHGGFTLKQFTPGTYQIDAGAEWTVVSPVRFVVPATSPLAVVVKKNTLADLAGKVVDGSGAPIPGVSLVYITNHSLPNGSQEGTLINLSTDASGSYTISGAPVDPQMVSRNAVTKDGYTYVSGGTLNKVGDHLTIDPIVMAQLSGVVSGTVLNGLNAPVDGAWVTCRGGAAASKPVRTDSAGHFKIVNLVPGAGELYVSKGRYAAQVPVQVTANTTDTTVTLAQQSEPPAPSDLKTGIQFFNQLLVASATAGSQQSIGDRRDQCATILGAISQNQALNFLGSFAEINSTDLHSVVDPQGKINAVAAAKWAIPLLQRTFDNGSEGSIAAQLGLEVVSQDNLSANILYNIAVRKIPLNNLSEYNLDDAERLTALAYATHRPEADDDYQKVQAALKAAVAAVVKQNYGNDGGYLVSGLAVNMALGNLPLALQILPTVSDNYRPSTYYQIISELIGPNPKAAMSVFQLLQNDSAQTPTWAYYQAIPTVLPYIFKTDPRGAVTLAKSIPDSQSRSEALATVADLLPLSQAMPLYKEAETDSFDQGGPGTPGSVAEHAYIRDPALGKLLFAQAFEKVTTADSSQQPWQVPSYAEFAYYYSRIDPGYSRVLLENQFLKDQKNPSQYDSPGQSTVSDAAAMAAIDPARALEMANTIKDPDTRFMAGLKVASYVLLTQSQRDTLPFASFAQMWGNWTPGVATPW